MNHAPDPESKPQAEHHGPGSHREGSLEPSRPGTGLAARRLDPVLLALSWVILIIGVVLWSLKPSGTAEEASPDEVPMGRLVDAQIEMSGRISLGLSELLPGMSARTQVTPLMQGSAADQLSYVLFVAATATPREGAEVLDEVVESNPVNPVIEDFAPLVRSTLEAAEDGVSPSEETSRILVERFGWYGRLATAMADPERLREIERESRKSAFVLMLFVGVFTLTGLLGFIGLVLLIVLAVSNPVRIRFPFPIRHGVYAETFALWLLLMLFLQLIMAGIAVDGGELLMSIIAFFASLGALVWPVIRGVPWSQVRTDIGLTAPHWSDIPTGVAAWGMALPILAVGLIITLVLMLFQSTLMGDSASPSHPAQQAVAGAGTSEIVQLFILACVAAPVVEEIMFRGVFLTHLGGWSRKWPRLLSLAFAIGLSSFVFAAIHPQGFTFIPPLAGLAVGFCIARLWRGSLGPAMVAHGFSNGVVMTLNVLLFTS